MVHEHSKTGRRIKTERERLNWTQGELAAAISENGTETSQKTVLAWENGKRAPDLPRIDIMSELFGCERAYLLGDYADGERRRSNADVAAATGLTGKAIEKLERLRAERRYADQLSALIEWDGFEDLMQDVCNLIAFAAAANLEEHEQALYEESKLDSEKAVKFYAQRNPTVPIDAAAYEDQLDCAEALAKNEVLKTALYGDVLRLLGRDKFDSFLTFVMCQLALDD